jgi:O-acetyl-ADP-ribose deacetylase (regulator of RNase III)
MLKEKQFRDSNLKIQKGDLTDLNIESFVFYAREDLKLGSGFGTAISVRGGPSIQEELDKLAPIKMCEAVITNAGEMKAGFIVHVVGPRFQEEDMDGKLRTAIVNALKAADKKGIADIAFPPMGAGFYGVPLDQSARITLNTIKEYLLGDTTLKNVTVCLLDNREYRQFEREFASLN